MENMNQLRDLLKHEIKDLYSAEEQIIEALPKMIEKANNKQLKKTLQQHLDITEQQKDRLDEVLERLGEVGEEENSGILGVFKSGDKCLAMEGIIKEGQKLMKEDMSPEVSDAAIIAAAQKVEHYEISSYGTARAYAQELNLREVQHLLKQTLDEEYEADDLLTELAESRVNEKAIPENGGSGSSRQSGRSGSRRRSSNAGKTHSRSVTTAKASSARSGSSRDSSSKTSRDAGGAPSKKSPSKRSSGRGRSDGRSGSR
jgi:ferritin-like metal-binding protein YciE